MTADDFPKTLFVHQTVGTDDGDKFLASDHHEDAVDGDLVAVYELKEVKEMKVTRELVEPIL